jgi:hypothetical protein
MGIWERRDLEILYKGGRRRRMDLLCNISNIKSMQNRNKMLEMVE